MTDAHTGMGPLIPAPKLDPHCQCICHTQPGIVHVAACCTAPDLIPRADANLAVAEAIRRAADVGKVVGDGHYGDEVHAAIHRIAPADALAEVQRLREERDTIADRHERALLAGAEVRAERDAALARVGKLLLQLDQKDALYDSAYQAGVKVGWNLGVSDDEAGFRAATSSTEHVAELKRIRTDFARADAEGDIHLLPKSGESIAEVKKDDRV